MCRRDRFWGLLMAAFGAGLLLGLWLDKTFLCHCIGLGLIIIGCSLLGNR